MAKVTNQVLPGSDISYIDASGETHYDSDLARHIFPPAYPMPSTGDKSVVRRSMRYHRPSDQGTGSPEQTKWRMCFQECAARWNSLPEECPDPPTYPPTSSKKNVWDAKEEQGVRCSYFDLYMGCCMKSCTSISINIPGIGELTGGTINPNEDCWPCIYCGPPDGLAIGYTTQQMSVNQTQGLSAPTSLIEGDNPPCIEEELKWSLISGGGSLSATFGQSVIYTAPASNKDCDANATIELTDCCGRVATLQIAINATLGNLAGFDWPSMGCIDYAAPKYGCYGLQVTIYCDGSTYSANHSLNPNFSSCGDCQDYLLFLWGNGDVRSSDQLEAGCCPEQFL